MILHIPKIIPGHPQNDSGAAQNHFATYTNPFPALHKTARVKTFSVNDDNNAACVLTFNELFGVSFI